MKYAYRLPAASVLSALATIPADTAGPLTVSMQPAATGSYARAAMPISRAPTCRSGAGDVTEFQRPRDIGHAASGRDRPVESGPGGRGGVSLGPRGRLRQEFTLTFGPGTLSAHYPIHAYAEFDYQARNCGAPVMIVQTRIPDAARPRLPVEWKPVAVPNGGMLGLWRIPVRRERTETVRLGATRAGGQEVFDAGTVILYGRWRAARRKASP